MLDNVRANIYLKENETEKYLREGLRDRAITRDLNWGVDVPVEKFVEAAADPEVKIVGVSALLTTTMPAMKDTVAALNAAPNRANFKVMVGGAPITAEFAAEIGADAYTTDAASAASVAKDYVK